VKDIGFFRRHWNGDHSLVQMSVFNFLAINLHILVVGAVPTVVFIIHNPVIRQRFYLAWILFIFCVVIPWQWIGMIRGSLFDWFRIQNYGGVILAGLVSVFSTFLLFYYVLPTTDEFRRTYETSFKIDRYVADIQIDGSRLVLSGALHFGTAAKVNQLVRKNNITELQIEVSAGHLYEARELAYMVQERGLDVTVNRVCLAPCTLILAAGNTRTVSESARIGFQSYKALFPDARSSWFVIQNTNKDLAWLQSLGIDSAFVYQSFYLQTNVPYWEPSKALMLAKGMVDVVTNPADIAQ
jgi:hypothetical protein